ncbi:hypothetical protein [Sphingomonas sp.]|uniref:hypothetical protein n=1 Tax=Sphingomonas sp. TaxID=28214 RepID=UPI003D6CBC02
MNRLKSALITLPALAISSPTWAQTASAAETGVTAGFAKIQAIVDLAVPLMIGIAAIVVAATWGLRMLKKA